MSYVGLDETGRIQSVTEKQEYAAPGAIEFEFPEGFDLARIDDFLRISVGTDEEADCLMEFLKDYLEKRKA